MNQKENPALKDKVIDTILTPEGKRYKMPCKINPKAYNNYKQAIEILKGLRYDDRCIFDAPDPDLPYPIHAIYIRWWLKDDDDPFVINSMNRTEIFKLIRLAKNCCIERDESNVWHLQFRIYIPLDKTKA